MVNWYRCRYLSNKTLSYKDLTEFIHEITNKGIIWTHIEVLRKEGDKEMFSKAQGE